MQQMKYKNSDEGKLDTYYKVKDCFRREKYLDLKHFNIRQSISKLRLSAHSLKIETGRFGQNRRKVEKTEYVIFVVKGILKMRCTF